MCLCQCNIQQIILIQFTEKTRNIIMSRVMRKPTMWILTRSDTNQAVQQLEMARGLKFCI